MDQYTEDCRHAQALADIAEDEEQAQEAREERRERLAELNDRFPDL